MALVKVVNTSDRPFEFTYDGLNFPAIPPGGVAEYPEEIARHALRKSDVLDDEGQPAMRRLELFVASTPAARERMNKILLYSCPFAEIDGCSEGPFPREDLVKHIEKHRPSKAKSIVAAKDTDY